MPVRQSGSPRQQCIGAISTFVDSIDSRIILRMIRESKMSFPCGKFRPVENGLKKLNISLAVGIFSRRDREDNFNFCSFSSGNSRSIFSEFTMKPRNGIVWVGFKIDFLFLITKPRDSKTPITISVCSAARSRESAIMRMPSKKISRRIPIDPRKAITSFNILVNNLADWARPNGRHVN